MMQSTNHAIAAYRSAASQVSPLVAVVRLYDEAIRRLRMAIVAIEDKKHEDSFTHINKASIILRGLCHNLRFDKGEDVADKLLKAYTYNIIAIHTAYGKADAPAQYARIASSLGTLRDSWAEIAGMQTKFDEPGRSGKI